MHERLDHSGLNALSLFEENFCHPAQLMRASTGYFSFKGWNLLRKILNCMEVRILIGFDENSEDTVKQKMVSLIMDDLSRWHEAERREAIRSIAESMRKGAFTILQSDQLQDMDLRAGDKDHTKVYILDDEIVLAGSANLTDGGLRKNRENLTAIREPVRKVIYIEAFEKAWSASNRFDITAEILALLDKWLSLVDPYDIYLKSVDTLMPRREEYSVKPSYKRPNAYQEDVVNQMERQLEQYNGCILIASTGLGKTVMATETALRLSRKGLVDSVIVFAPAATRSDWEKTVKASRVSMRFFTRNLLDIPEEKGKSALEDMLNELDLVDDKTLIIVDETQYLANRYANPKRNASQRKNGRREREAYKRLREAVQQKKAYIIMMTATPFVKRAQDINNQLSLLPHTGDPISRDKRGQLRLLLSGDEDVTTEWSVPENDHFFESFVKLPISMLITTAYVGKHYCTPTEKGEFLDFPDKRRWLPRIENSLARFPFAFETEMDVIFRDKVLEHRTFKFRDRDFNLQRSQKTITQRVITAWSSSPEALLRILEKASTDTWEETIPFKYPLEERAKRLARIIRKLKQHKPKDDQKLTALKGIIQLAVDEGRKVIVFVEALPTAGYLERNLKKHGWRVVSTISYDKVKDTYRTKPREEAQRILNHFAPVANAGKFRGKVEESDILITSDAFGSGVNLEDASVVINYDLAWTADTIIQRAGRVMRFWEEPRTVQVYTFLPLVGPDASSAVLDAVRRVHRLQQRTSEAVKFSEYFFLMDDNKASSFGDLSQIVIEPLGPITPDTVESMREVSPMLDRRAELRFHPERLAKLGEDIISALGKPFLTVPHLYMLVRVDGRPILILYDVENRRLIPKQDNLILDFIHCSPDEPVALIKVEQIEQEAEACIRLWSKEKQVEPDDVERICTMLIVPKGKADLLV